MNDFNMLCYQFCQTHPSAARAWGPTVQPPSVDAASSWTDGRQCDANLAERRRVGKAAASARQHVTGAAASMSRLTRPSSAGSALLKRLCWAWSSAAGKVVANQRRATLLPVIDANLIPGGSVHTDESSSYLGLTYRGCRLMTVNYSAHEYVGFDCASTNAVGGFWSAEKRGINGTHIHVSAKHLPKYLAEFEYRWNMRSRPHAMLDRWMVSFAR